MLKRILLSFLLLFILSDTLFSAWQYYNTKLDGDMARVIVPESDCKHVLVDPFGLDVILKDSIYVGTNRYFVHAPIYAYYRIVPSFLQKVTDPITSVYLATAMIKIFVHITLAFILSLYAYLMVGKKVGGLFLITMALVLPFFQANGYYNYMGIVDKSVSYTFCYAIPFAFLLLFFMPFYRSFVRDRTYQFSKAIKMFLFLVCFYLGFSSPLIPGVVLLVCPGVLVYEWRRNYLISTETFYLNRGRGALLKIPGNLLFYFSFLILLSLYSLYIGLNNKENFNSLVDFGMRYSRIPFAIFHILTEKPGIPILIIMVLLNKYLIKKYAEVPQAAKINNLLNGFFIFFIAYLALIPLGGYRSYRPDIYRYDTILPITLVLIMMYAMSSIVILNGLPAKFKKVYIIVLFLIGLIYTNADRFESEEHINEEIALREIASSNDTVVKLKNNCTVMDWGIALNYKETETNAELMLLLGITKKKKLYFQVAE